MPLPAPLDDVISSGAGKALRLAEVRAGLSDLKPTVSAFEMTLEEVHSAVVRDSRPDQ